MNIHKIISTFLHPIIVPTIVVMLYFLIIPIPFDSDQKYAVLSLIFVITYLIPLLILILFKRVKLIKTFKTDSIRERKLPVALMSLLFYILGITINNITLLKSLVLLFYAASLGLIIVYFLFFIKLKTSVHLLSLGIAAGFFVILGYEFSQSFIIIIIIIMVIIFLSGLLASTRLHLKAHTVKEVYLGFLIGILCPIILYVIL